MFHGVSIICPQVLPLFSQYVCLVNLQGSLPKKAFQRARTRRTGLERPHQGSHAGDAKNLNSGAEYIYIHVVYIYI